MLISKELSTQSPLFELERSGATVTVTLSYGLSGYYDEEAGYYFWDGDIGSELAGTGDYYYNNVDRPMDLRYAAVFQPGRSEAGYYEINDFQDGTYLRHDFSVMLFDQAADMQGGDGSNYVFGSAEGDRLVLGGGADAAEGGEGHDAISGGSGDDTISGGAGADTLRGDAGRDALGGGSGADLVSGGGGADQLSGGSGADTLLGGSGNDILRGGASGDRLAGGAGNDTLSGDAGADRLDGGDGFDVASYAGSSERVVASLKHSADNSGAAAGDVFLRVEGLIGSKFDDLLTGSASADALSGRGGADTLVGGGGADTLAGGAGSDVFLFNVAPGEGGVVQIVDFNVARDRIDLNGALFLGVELGPLADEAFAIAAGGVAQTANTRVIYDDLTGGLFHDADGAGGEAAIRFATLKAGIALTADVFTVF